MTITHYTKNVWHLGDQLVHLHFLRSQAIAHPDHNFIHTCDPAQHFQLIQLIDDLPNIRLSDQFHQGSIDAWINQGAERMDNQGRWQKPGFLDSHKHKWEWSTFTLDWFRHLAGQMGLESKFKTSDDLLFDCPRLMDETGRAGSMAFDFLVGNSRPGSGQLASFRDNFCFDPLIELLVRKGYKVACTQPSRVKGAICTQVHHLTVLDIGRLSLRTPNIVSVSTGIDWLTRNIWNRETVKTRITLLDRVRELPGGKDIYVSSVLEAQMKLKEHGLI